MTETTTTTKMDPALKAKWLEALRSGKYAQGEGALCRDSNYCCLGVLADIVDPNAWIFRGPDKYSSWKSFTCFFDEDKDEELGIGGHSNDLMAMNDGDHNGRKYTFAEIADWIEENL